MHLFHSLHNFFHHPKGGALVQGQDGSNGKIASIIKTHTVMEGTTTPFQDYELKPQTFKAAKFDGDYDNIRNAAEAISPGSADSFKYTEHGEVLGFTDANGNEASITKGDYLKVVPATDPTLKAAFLAVPATEGDANWQTTQGTVILAGEVAANEAVNS